MCVDCSRLETSVYSFCLEGTSEFHYLRVKLKFGDFSRSILSFFFALAVLGFLFAQRMFLSGFLSNYRDIEIPIEDIIQAYASWVKEDRYMVLERLKPTWDAPKSSTMFEKETIAVKSAKRGNDVYSRRVLSKFSMFEDLLTDLNLVYFTRGKMRTQVLFITLTYDTKLRSQHQAWKTLSKFYNLFMSKMRRVFGSISSARFLQLH